MITEGVFNIQMKKNLTPLTPLWASVGTGGDVESVDASPVGVGFYNDVCLN